MVDAPSELRLTFCPFVDYEARDWVVKQLYRGVARAAGSDDNREQISALFSAMESEVMAKAEVQAPIKFAELFAFLAAHECVSVDKDYATRNDESAAAKTLREKLGLVRIERWIDEFATSKRSGLSTLFKSQDRLLNEAKINQQRIETMAQSSPLDAILSPDNVEKFATKLLMTTRDPAVHCPATFSDEEVKGKHIVECPFKPIPCAHQGCEVVMSTYKLDAHDARCGYKPLPCPQGCGESVIRMDVPAHMTGPCDMRPVQCPYTHIGCRDAVVVRTLPEHLKTKTDGHLWLALLHIEEQNKKIDELQGNVQKLREIVDVTLKDMKAQHDKEVKQLYKDINATRGSISSAEKNARQLVDGLRKEHKEAQDKLLRGKK